MGDVITAIDYSLLLTLKSMFRDGKYGREHNKHDFDADYNNFVLMQDKLAILANYESARGGINILLSYLDDNVVGSAIKDACNDKRYLSKAIENAYLVEDLKAKLDGNKSFDDDALVRYYVAEQGYGLDKLINDESGFVRAYVARQGYGLDKLVDDEDSYVREAVAEQGYGLDKLVHDDAVIVRDAVAKQGYGLDILIDDGNRDVRMTVAHQGYGLDKLINDDYWGVRAEIANQGYGLDKLIHDEEPKVRLLAYDALRAEEEQQKSNQQGKRRVLFVQDNYDDEIENSEFDFDV